MHAFKLSMTALVLALLVTGCSATGQSVSTGVCVGALRLNEAQIATLSGEQARRLLDINEDQRRRGCAQVNPS